jgi:hypothetical protein
MFPFSQEVNVENKQDHHFLRLAGKILGTTVLISLAVLLIGYLLHWSDPIKYSNGFFTAGAILIVLGVYSVVGGFAQRADYKMTYAESAGQANLAQRNQRMADEITQRYGTLIFLVVTGLLLVLIAVGIGQILIPAS